MNHLGKLIANKTSLFFLILLALGMVVSSISVQAAWSPNYWKTVSGAMCKPGGIQGEYDGKIKYDTSSGASSVDDGSQWVYCPIELDTKVADKTLAIYLYYDKKPNSNMRCEVYTVDWIGIEATSVYLFPPFPVGENKNFYIEVPTPSWGHVDVSCSFSKAGDGVRQITYKHF